MIRTHILPSTIPRAHADNLNRSSGEIYTGILVATGDSCVRRAFGSPRSPARGGATPAPTSGCTPTRSTPPSKVSTRRASRPGRCARRGTPKRSSRTGPRYRTTIWKNTGIKRGRRPGAVERPQGHEDRPPDPRETAGLPAIPRGPPRLRQEGPAVLLAHRRRERHPAQAIARRQRRVGGPGRDPPCRRRRQGTGDRHHLPRAHPGARGRPSGWPSSPRQSPARPRGPGDTGVSCAPIADEGQAPRVLRDIKHKVSHEIVEFAAEHRRGRSSSATCGTSPTASIAAPSTRHHRPNHGKIRSTSATRPRPRASRSRPWSMRRTPPRPVPTAGIATNRGAHLPLPVLWISGHRDVVGQINILSRYLEGDVGRLPLRSTSSIVSQGTFGLCVAVAETNREIVLRSPGKRFPPELGLTQEAAPL